MGTLILTSLLEDLETEAHFCDNCVRAVARSFPRALARSV